MPDPKKPINPFAAITDTPLHPPPPPETPDEIKTENRHRNHMQWLRELDRGIGTLKWLLFAILLINLTTCAAVSCERTITFRQTR